MKMTKKTSFLFLLFLIVFGTANLYAQVTIGSDEEPHSGAILDLKSDNKGLKLPSVSLSDTAVFQLSANPSDAVSAKGMMVYNTNDNTTGGRGQGIYTWNGTWIYSGGAPRADIPVSRIVITSPENASTVNYGDALKLTANVLPADASNPKLAWSALWSSSLIAGKVVVNDTGLVIGVKSGGVTVRASAIDGSGAYRDFTLTVLPTDVATGISLSSETGADSVKAGRTLQLMAMVTPDHANPNVKWEVTDGEKVASVSTAGVVTGVSEGEATIQARTMDGSALSVDTVVKVTAREMPSDTVGVLLNGVWYLTRKFGNTTWMIDPLKCDTAIKKGNGVEDTGYHYFSSQQAQNICPSGWALPNDTQAQELIDYVTWSTVTVEKDLWVSKDRVGYWSSASVFAELNVTAPYWLEGTNRYFSYNGSWKIHTWAAYAFMVKCVKDE
ncbi:MAG: Ig-like domain-containing protein [Dysgonamonadaceae bacterium]|jgi:uncharacterized protein (TIGR02145 family)|nr:Ig-like domain-containing protein [Dysgonamonadaceae bacterium]